MRQPLFVALALAGASAAPVLEVIDTGVQPEKWAALNQLVQPFVQSGGSTSMSGDLVQYYFSLASMPWVHTICKSRIQAGHAAMLLLMANPNATVRVYDPSPPQYAGDVAALLGKEFPGRFSFTAGDAGKLKQEHPGEKCDLMIVGGMHGFDPNDTASADLNQLQAMANAEHNYVVMDDTPCAAAYCQSRQTVWKSAVTGGQVYEFGQQTMASGVAGVSLGSFRPLQAAPAAPALAQLRTALRHRRGSAAARAD